MKTRILAALVLIPILFAVFLIAPIWVAAVVIGLMSAIASYELLHNTGLVSHIRVNIYAAILAFGVSIWCYFGSPRIYALFAILALFALLFAEMMHSALQLEAKALLLCAFAGMVVPYMLSSLLRIRMMQQGRIYIFIPFLVAFLSDTGAYFAGLSLGRHKLCPKISPKKTVEGFIGGILTAILGMIIFKLLVNVEISWLFAIVMGLFGSLGGVFGDLSMSVIKRQTGIKDYGNLIPGHGGILDRFDSVLVTAPLTELMLLLFLMV